MALTEAELQNRRKYIGGSDAKTVLEGDAKAWKELYDEKVNDVRRVIPANIQLMMDVGTAVEPLILREFNKKVALAPASVVKHMVWQDNPLLAFTPDGITIQDRLVVQCKFHSGDQDIFKLAESYKAQLTHEMICSNTTRMWLAVIFGHYTRFMHMEIKADEKIVEQYLMKAMEFGEYLKTGKMPDSMVDEVATMHIERKRDHVWNVADNRIAPLCTDIMENMPQAVLYSTALEEMKELIKKDKQYADCGSLTWRNLEGYGVTFKPDARGAIRHSLAFPPRPLKRPKKVKAA